MPSPTVSFLGPEGTFAHLAARKRFGDTFKLVPAKTIRDVFDYVCKDRSNLGVVPIENSSGGTIYDTVDRLVDGSYSIFVREALSVNVKLALLGKDRKSIRVIYSHFAPLHHCEAWLRTHFPNVELREEASTGIAVRKASEQKDAAAIGYRDAAKLYHMKVLEFPIEKKLKNVTQFLVLGNEQGFSKDSSRTTLVFTLPNKPGSLVKFLKPFDDRGVNLSRIISRPIIGEPDTYVFLTDVFGSENQEDVRAAIKAAAKVTAHIRSIGSYPVRKPYES